MANVEVGRSAKLSRIVNILDRSAVLAGSGFGSRSVVNRVRERVIEIERETAAESAAERQGHPMKRRPAGIHPRGHCAALP